MFLWPTVLFSILSGFGFFKTIIWYRHLRHYSDSKLLTLQPSRSGIRSENEADAVYEDEQYDDGLLGDVYRDQPEQTTEHDLLGHENASMEIEDDPRTSEVRIIRVSNIRFAPRFRWQDRISESDIRQLSTSFVVVISIYAVSFGMYLFGNTCEGLHMPKDPARYLVTLASPITSLIAIRMLLRQFRHRTSRFHVQLTQFIVILGLLLWMATLGISITETYFEMYSVLEFDKYSYEEIRELECQAPMRMCCDNDHLYGSNWAFLGALLKSSCACGIVLLELMFHIPPIFKISWITTKANRGGGR
ncbi:hypothetical protein PT974_09548 [Cladobotryum mycophilum]|uniref:Uncharacterized protein n=1 Tax=Cladobotryum mycophilum TaxID=491253 RepID=A0ABR0SGI4_9HYPO